MSVIMNARGTSVPFFSIGNRGITVYQGSADPALTYTVKNGDLWVDTSTSFVKMRKAGTWGSSSPAGVTSVDIASPSEGIHFSGGPITTSGTFGVALANDLAAVEGLTTTGIVRRTATDTWTAGTLVDLNAEVQGNLAVNHLNSGVGATATTFWCGDNTWKTPSTGVTSVGVSGANGIGVSGSPITSSGTIALTLGAITPTSLALTSLNPNRVLYLNGSQVASVSAGLTYDGSTLGVGATNTAASILAVGSNGTNPLIGTLQQGVSSVMQATANATAGSIGNVSSVSTVAGVFTMPFAMAYRAQTVGKGSGSTISYAIGYYADPQSQGTNNASFADNRAFSGNWFINQADTTPTQLNGLVGLGGTTVSNAVVNVGASNPLTTGSQIGVATNMTLPATTTTGMTGFSNSVTTASSAFTLPYAVGYTANSPTIGVGSTITNTVGYYAPVSTSGTNNSAFSDNRTSTGNWFINQAGSAPSTFGGPVTFAGSQTVSGGTANSIQYLNGSKVSSTTATFAFNGTNFAVGTSTLSAALVTLVGGVTDSGGESSIRISSSAPSTIPATIGTGSSSATLQLFGGASALAGSARGGQIDLLGGGVGGVILFRTGVATGGTSQPEQMRLDALGNLGVGVTPSAWGASFKAIEMNGGAMFTPTSGASLYAVQNGYYNGTNWIYKTTAPISATLQTAGTHTWYMGASATAGATWSIPTSANMTLDSSGGNSHLTLVSAYNSGSANYSINLSQSGLSGGYLAGGAGGASGGFALSQGGWYYGSGNYITDANSTSYASIVGVAGALSFYANAGLTASTQFSPSPKMTLDSNGNIGLGVVPSTWSGGNTAIQIVGSSHVAGAAALTTGYNYFHNTTPKYLATGPLATQYVQVGGNHQWNSAPAGTAGANITFTEYMRLDSTGNLGIGTSTISSFGHGGTNVIQQIHNAGTATNSQTHTIYTSGYNTSGASTIGSISFALPAASTGGLGRIADVSGVTDSASTMAAPSGGLTFSTKGVGDATALGRMTLDAGGRLLVNTTTAIGGASESIQTIGLVSGGQNYCYLAAGPTSGVSAFAMRSYSTTAAAVVGSIQFTSSATSYNTSSDYRLKNVDGPLIGSGEFIDALQPKQGTWKVDGSKFVGFIAHEVQVVSPSTTHGVKDAVDETGKPVYQGMEYGSAEFIANIVAELQNLRKRVASLESQLTASPQQ